MKKINFLICLCITISGLNAQDVKSEFKDGIQYVNGQPVFQLEKVNRTGYSGYNDVIVKNMSGDKLMYLKSNEIKDPKINNGINRENYYEYIFMKSGNKAEYEAFLKLSKIADVIVKANLVKDGETDAKSEEDFILINGTKYSELRNSLAPANTVIINNNPPPPPPQNQINIKIGK